MVAPAANVSPDLNQTQPPGPDATKDKTVTPAPELLELRSLFQVSSDENVKLRDQIKSYQEAEQRRSQLNATAGQELTDARTQLGTQAAQLDEMSKRLLMNQDELAKSQAEVKRLNSVLAATSANSITNLPTGTFAMCESATITIFSGGPKHQCAVKDDVLVVCPEADLAKHAIRYPKRRVYCVEQSTVDELRKLGMLYS